MIKLCRSCGRQVGRITIDENDQLALNEDNYCVLCKFAKTDNERMFPKKASKEDECVGYQAVIEHHDKTDKSR